MRSNCAYFCFIFSNLTTDPVFVKLKINAMSLVIGKMQTKTTMSYITAYSVECLKLKKNKQNKTATSTFGKDLEQPKFSNTTDRV